MQEMQEMKVQSLGREDSLDEGMQPTPVFLPGESHGQRNLEDHSHGVAETWTQLSTQGHTWTVTNKQELKAVDNLPKSVRLPSSIFIFLMACFPISWKERCSSPSPVEAARLPPGSVSLL